jgi:hypothetical protein
MKRMGTVDGWVEDMDGMKEATEGATVHERERGEEGGRAKWACISI